MTLVWNNGMEIEKTQLQKIFESRGMWQVYTYACVTGLLNTHWHIEVTRQNLPLLKEYGG